MAKGKTAQGAVGVGGDAKARGIAGELSNTTIGRFFPPSIRSTRRQPSQVRAFDIQYLADLLRRGDKITHGFKCHVSSRSSKE